MKGSEIAKAAAVRVPEVSRLVEAAKTVIARWDTPQWKDKEPTAGAIEAMREAIEALEEAPVDFSEIPEVDEDRFERFCYSLPDNHMDLTGRYILFDDMTDIPPDLEAKRKPGLAVIWLCAAVAAIAGYLAIGWLK